MSEQQEDQTPPRQQPVAYATVKSLHARFDRRALAWFCRNDLPASAVPEPPAAVQNLCPPERRQSTCEVWQATLRLLQALDTWQEWFANLRANGDADPAVALWCQATACQSVRALCAHRVNLSPFDCAGEAAILAMLPPTPDWSMAGTDEHWDPEQKQFVARQRPRWQEDPVFLGRYYGGEESRAETATRLRGVVLQLRLLLESFPATALSSGMTMGESQATRQTVQDEIEHINHWHRLAGRCLNTVVRLQTLGHYADGDQHARDTLIQLQQVVNDLSDLPGADDPFSGADVVEVAGVTATSMHVAAFTLARRTWQAVQLASLAADNVTEHQEKVGQPYTRITWGVSRHAPTETAWSSDVWRQNL